MVFADKSGQRWTFSALVLAGWHWIPAFAGMTGGGGDDGAGWAGVLRPILLSGLGVFTLTLTLSLEGEGIGFVGVSAFSVFVVWSGGFHPHPNPNPLPRGRGDWFFLGLFGFCGQIRTFLDMGRGGMMVGGGVDRLNCVQLCLIVSNLGWWVGVSRFRGGRRRGLLFCWAGRAFR